MKVIHLVRKPLSEGSVAANILKHGTGSLNIDASRINPGQPVPGGGNGEAHKARHFGARETCGERPIVQPHNKGRWPANLILEHASDCCFTECAPECLVVTLDAQSGTRRSSGIFSPQDHKPTRERMATSFGNRGVPNSMYEDHGGASRFFLQVRGKEE